MTRYEKYIQIDNFVDLFHKHCMDDIYDCCEKSPLRVDSECPVDEEERGEESCKKCIRAWMLEGVEGMTYANGNGFAGKWIPVSVGLPEFNDENECYDMDLVTLDNGDVCMGVYRHDDKEWWTRMSEGEDGYSPNNKVLAWMPLPKPYVPGNGKAATINKEFDDVINEMIQQMRKE